VKKCLALFCLWLVAAAGAVAAPEQSSHNDVTAAGARPAPESRKGKKPVKPQQKLTPDREAAAMAFVRRHHPELADLLSTLKKTDARQYQRAINALSAAGRHLEELRQRSVERYERELREWKLRSRIQLLVAQIRMAPDKVALQQALRQALADQLELRQARLTEERERLADRLEKLDDQLDQLKKDRGAVVDKQMEMLLRTGKRRAVNENHPRAAQPGDAPSGDSPQAGSKTPL